MFEEIKMGLGWIEVRVGKKVWVWGMEGVGEMEWFGEDEGLVVVGRIWMGYGWVWVWGGKLGVK